MTEPHPVTLRILPRNLKPGVTILFNGGHRETVTEVRPSNSDFLVVTDLHPNGIRARADQPIAIEG